MPLHSGPSTRPVRPSHQVCEAPSIAIQDGLCGLDVHATPTDDEVAEEEGEELQVNDEHSELLLTLASPATNRSRSTGHEGTSRSVRGANGAILAEAEVSRTEHGQNPPSPLWFWTISS